ncbi:Rieske 2Fe-2S domain-containing protein [Actinomadura sp. LOL_016]|uniref:Rieske 2Fe-2S domain-containing protein n=1 Tax=unclassified Actinomadura TaxID=2626254 RepID=UPI003A80B4A1
MIALLSPQDNERLCRIGPGTDMGRVMRRYWLPVELGSNLAAGGAPRSVRLLGEDLVVFRDSAGRVAVMDEYCPHRGASLALARNEECGLRCIYHGWLIDGRGRIVDIPNEPEPDRLREKVRHTAYRAEELGGVVWAYLGPPELELPVPRFEWTGMPSEHVAIMRLRVDCNWVQVLEGLVDSSHAGFLHSDHVRPVTRTAAPEGGTQVDWEDGGRIQRPSDDQRPRMEVQDADYGFRSAAIRRTLWDPDRKKYVRTTLFVAPVYTVLPAIPGWGTMQFPVPLDDEHTMFYNIQYCYEQPVDEEYLREKAGCPPEDSGDDPHPVRRRENRWQQDRTAMQSGASWSGIDGIMLEDLAVQESMGPIYDRSREHLGATDRAVTHMRRVLLRAADSVGRGEAPIGASPDIAHERLRADDRVIDIDQPWQTVGDFSAAPSD